MSSKIDLTKLDLSKTDLLSLDLSKSLIRQSLMLQRGKFGPLETSKIKFKVTYYSHFYFVVCQCFAEISKLEKIKEDIAYKDDIGYKDENGAINTIMQLIEIDQKFTYLGMTSIVFGIMTLESFINQYVSEKVSSNYLKKHLDKLSIESKWVVIPKLVTGNSIDTDCQAFEHFVQLIRLRNKLVHDKVNIVKFDDYKTSPFGIKEANLAKQAVKEMIGKLHEIDPSVQIKWIEIEEHRAEEPVRNGSTLS